MPKRIVDGEAIADSRTLRKVPEEFRIHYPYLITLAMANGVFECDPDSIWSKRYSLLMPSVTPEIVSDILTSFEEAGLLFRWLGDGRPMVSQPEQIPPKKWWGFWTRINLGGRLPPKSRGSHERLGPEVPVEELAKYMEKHADNNGYPSHNHGSGNGTLGLGLSLGLGKGKEQKLATSHGSVADPRHHAIRQAVKAIQKGLTGEEIWDGSAAAALDRLLKKQPKFPLDKFLQGVVNRFSSEGRSPTEHPRVWLGSILEYVFAPLDRFNKVNRQISTQHLWDLLDPPTEESKISKQQEQEAAWASHAEFVRGLGDKAPPDEKKWLHAYEQAHPKTQEVAHGS